MYSWTRTTICLVVFTGYLICFAHASPSFPTPTFAGLRDAQAVEFEVLPTPNAWSPSEILKRLNGDPAVCGWIDGAANNTVSCNSGYTCAATSTYVGCCTKGAAGCAALFTTCYDARGPSCDASCSANAAALICQGQIPYCAQYVYSSGSIGFGCAVMTGYTKTVLNSTTGGGPTPFGGSSATNTAAGMNTVPTPSNAPSASVAAVSTASPSPTSAASSKTISGGAIAGIAIGGTVAVIVVGVIIWFLLQKHRAAERNRKSVQSYQSSMAPSYSHRDQMVYSPQPKPPENYYSPPISPPMFPRTDSYGYPPNGSEHGPFHPDSIRSGHRSNPSIPYTGPNLPEVMGSMPPELDSDSRPLDHPPHGEPPQQGKK